MLAPSKLMRSHLPKLYLLMALLVVSCSGNQDKGTATEKEVTKQDVSSKPGSQINAQYFRGAALQGEIAEVKKALEQGVGVNAADESGRTALMLAAYNGHSDIVELLLEEGAEVQAKNSEGRTPLIFAASGPYAETVQLLLEWDADPNVVDSIEGWSALMFAAAGGHAGVVETLLSYGADTQLQDKDGDQAITFARNNNHIKVVSILENAE